jgi:NADH-quinone oxidoreductase subunit H
MLIVAFVASIVFLGCWLSPFQLIDLPFIDILPESWLILDGTVFGIFWMFVKAIILIFCMMWFRWTFPRLRVDQLMYVCWKIFIPFALANVILISIWELIF